MTVALLCVAAPGGAFLESLCGIGVLITGLCGALPWLMAAALGSGVGSAPVSGLDVFRLSRAWAQDPGQAWRARRHLNSEAVPVCGHRCSPCWGTAVPLGVVGFGFVPPRVPAARRCWRSR